MSDPSEHPPTQPETVPVDLHANDAQDEQDELSPSDDDSEEQFDEGFDAMLSASDDVDPDIAP